MSEAMSLEAFLSKAEEHEKEYDWLGASESYEEALALVSEQDFSKIGEICERLGYAFHRASMQAESLNEFRGRMRQSIENYDKARGFYERLNESLGKPRMLRCDAMVAYIGYWLASEPSEKKRLLFECWRLTKEALKTLEKAGEACEHGKTYGQLSGSAILEFTLESCFEAREKIMKEAVEHGEQAITFLSTCEDSSELSRACAKTVVCLGLFGYYCKDVDEREEYFRKGMEYWAKAKELSEETAMTEFLYPVFGGQVLFGLEGTDEALANYKKALEFAKKTKDNFMIGCALDWLTYHTVWKLEAREDPDEVAQLNKVAGQCSEEARRLFSKILFTSPRGDLAWIEAYPVDYYFMKAGSETDLTKKRELLEKALKAAPDMLKRAEDSAYPEVISYAHGVSSFILRSLAKIETNHEQKMRLLEKALEQMNECARIVEQITPLLYWNRGVMQNALANMKSDLADLVRDPETRKNMLQEAAAGKENSIKLRLKELAFFEMKGSTSTPLFAALGGSQYEYGKLLNHLYDLTCNREHVRKAIEIFKQAIETVRKLNLRSRMAECCWKIAKAYDTLGEYLNAAQDFDLASDNYRSAAESVPQLKEFYQDHALYMQAWSEIEKARHHHKRQEYGSAEEHFEKAANIHKSLKQWSYLAPNYAAWAQVEHAEELSRRDQCEEALKAFEQAARLFEETKKSIHDGLIKIEDVDEKQMAANMVNTTDLRREYCMARIAIEEAKILDKKGDHYSSSEKYGSAAGTLEKIAQTLESEQDRREFKLIATLSEAWAKMTKAEAEESSSLYIDASQLFEEAKELSPNEKAKTLALGHSRFCKALEAGTKFSDTGDLTLHTVAIQHLQSAAKHYVKAGFQNASEYAKATELLLDAYMHMDNAKKETDPEKKARLYMMAEKVLQTSAGSFMKAEHPEKREQVLRLLEKVKEERELALSLSEVLHAPPIVSTTTVFSTPTPNQENPVGLERFDNADVQANIITGQRQLKVGENLNLEIELVNAGKGPALLIKITELIPQGFELAEKPEMYRVEDSYLNMKGKRIDPLRTEEVKLTLKPKVQGEFSLRPTILYLDENGKYKSHQPEPISITVKELGIKGWIKGER